MKLIREVPPLYFLDEDPIFPDPLKIEDEELVAIGGDFSVPRLNEAYRRGIFPWFIEEDYIYWFSPETRMIINVGEFKLSKSLSKVIRNSGMEVRFNTNFEAVIRACSAVPRKGEPTPSWISEEFIEGYLDLHRSGSAISVETYYEGKLVGGLYGVIVGRAFCGESMFAKMSNASKVALSSLHDKLEKEDFTMIDCQISSEHLTTLGGIEISRQAYIEKLEHALL